MAKFPNKPRSGLKTIAALYRSICLVIDYLPSLTVKGDGKNVSVTNKDTGTVISVKNNNFSNWKYLGDYLKYIFGEGIKSEYDEEICSGLEGIPKELLPQFVTLNLSGDNQYISAVIPSCITDPVIISYIGPEPSGGGGSGGIVYHAGSGINISGNTIQTVFEPGCDIWFWDHSNDYPNPGNYITIENGLSAGFGIKFRDNNPLGDFHMHYIGVDLVGGDYISIVTGTTAGGVPVDYPTIRCNLSAAGYIGLSTVYLGLYDTGALITTNLHGDGTTVTIDNDGTIHAINSPGPGPEPGTSYSAGSGINIFTSGGNEYIETTFRPGCDIWFWDHNSDTNPYNAITILNGLSAGHGIIFRDNDPLGDYHMHYLDVNISGGQWLEYNVSAATMSCTLTGDNSTVFINENGVISATAVSPNWTSLTPSLLAVNNNDHTLSAATQSGGGGGGSGFIPDWGHSKHDFGIPPTTYKPLHPTVAEHDGYLFAWASFKPDQLGYCFQTAQAHIVVNDAWMKVCEVSYPDKFYIVVNGQSINNKKFQRYPYGDIIHQMMLTGTTAGSGDTTQTISPTLYYRNDGDDVWDDNNLYVLYHGWTASSRDEILPSKIFTTNYLLRPFNDNWDIYFKKYNVYEYLNGLRGSWLTSYIDGYNIDVSQMLEDLLGYTGGWEQEAFFDQLWGLKGSAGNQIDRACWLYNGDYIYTNGSVDNGTDVYELTQTGLDEHRLDYDYVGSVTDNNMKMQAIGVGGGLCVPFRKGAQLSYVVNMDGRAVNIPTNYGTSGMTWAPAACCIVYYNHST